MLALEYGRNLLFNLCQRVRKRHFILSPLSDQELGICRRGKTFPARFPNANLSPAEPERPLRGRVSAAASEE